MKIYLPTCLAVSAVAILATTALGMEASVNKTSIEEGIVSLSASRLDSAKIDSLSIASDRENYSLDLSPNNSFSIDANNLPASDLTVENTNFGQPSYSVTTSIVDF